jgi:hypothetical protein
LAFAPTETPISQPISRETPNAQVSMTISLTVKNSFSKMVQIYNKTAFNFYPFYDISSFILQNAIIEK